MPDITGTLENYERSHGIAPGALTKAGWRADTYWNRPCLSFRTESGIRYRFTDGQKPKYAQSDTYKACWYGLKRAIARNAGVIVDCNGAASTIAADCYGVPAYSLQAGESTSPGAELLAELKGYTGQIIVAFDNDAPTKFAPEGAGHKGAIKRVKLYRSVGLKAIAVDLSLPATGNDLADFVAIHREQSLEALTKCKQLAIPADEKRRESKRDYPADTDLTELVRLALDALDRDRARDREEWYSVGMAVKAALGDPGFYLWDSWSRNVPEQYNERSARSVWKSIDQSGPIKAGTLFWMADKDRPGWRPRKERKPVAITPETTPDVADLTDAQERDIMAYCGKQAVALAKFCKALKQSGPSGAEMDLITLEEYSGVKYRTLCRALNDYNGKCLVELSVSTITPYILESSLVDPDCDRSDISQPAADKPRIRFIIPTSAQLSQRILDNFVIPVELRKRSKGFTGVALSAMFNVDPELVSAANAALAKDADAAKLSSARAELAKTVAIASKRLAQVTVTPQQQGVDWRKDYRASVAAKNIAANFRKQQSWAAAFRVTGIRRPALKRAEGRLKVIREEVYVNGPALTSAKALPKPREYDNNAAGVAMRYVTHYGEIRKYGYHGPRECTKEIEAGRPVRIQYQQAGLIRYMDSAEIAEERAKVRWAKEHREAMKLGNRERGLQAALKAKSKRKDKGAKEQAVGWTEDDALSWLASAEGALNLEIGKGLSIEDRLKRIALGKVERVPVQAEAPADYTRENYHEWLKAHGKPAFMNDFMQEQARQADKHAKPREIDLGYFNQ